MMAGAMRDAVAIWGHKVATWTTTDDCGHIDNDGRLNMRLPADLLERVDAFVEALRDTTSVRASRAEAARVLMERALDAASEIKRRKR